jgi:hypothetical protein
LAESETLANEKKPGQVFQVGLCRGRRTKNFLICGSCFWCASCFDLRSSIEICPSFMEGKVESISLSINEICEFRHDERRGVTLEFRTSRIV